ncbi:hypothetical protein GCM10017083_00890 [Thalassobaculum fulvum]|uniref:Uncharacterized protein n=1 Tax=Thalassobaculum fulvum TaxID=1633335 RepID=A0A919CMB0_9PROT|nr:hypothetical protein GCM10017083_00890 [Thalassobaculum fulvum]
MRSPRRRADTPDRVPFVDANSKDGKPLRIVVVLTGTPHDKQTVPDELVGRKKKCKIAGDSEELLFINIYEQ